MKLAVLSESPADEVAVRILVDGVLGKRTEPAELPRLRTRGWPSVHHVLPNVIYHLHYRTDCEGLAVVVDSNHSPLHVGQPSIPCGQDKCRLCLLRDAVHQTLLKLRPVPGKGPLKVAVGLAVPAIEAWYLAGKQPGISERAFAQRMETGAFPDRNQLKREVYGTDHYSLELETRRAVEEATRLAGDLDVLQRAFPMGFGYLLAAVRSW